MYCHIDMERLLPLHMYREFLHQSLVTFHCCFSCGIYTLEEVSLNTSELWMPNFIQIESYRSHDVPPPCTTWQTFGSVSLVADN